MYLEVKESNGFETVFLLFDEHCKHVGVVVQQANLRVVVDIDITHYYASFKKNFESRDLKIAMDTAEKSIKNFYIGEVLMRRNTDRVRAIEIYRKHVDPKTNLKTAMDAINLLV